MVFIGFPSNPLVTALLDERQLAREAARRTANGIMRLIFINVTYLQHWAAVRLVPQQPESRRPGSALAA
jgi:hypothetical protein